MSRTAFAGLEQLAPGAPLSTDGYAFQDTDRAIIDRLLRLGAVTHRHDGHAALANPNLAPTLTTADSGGSIPAGQLIYVTYTLTDADGGESLGVAPASIVTPGGFGTPSAAPGAAISYAAGTLLAGNFSYGITVTDGLGGETALGPTVEAIVNAGFPNAEVTLSGLVAAMDSASGGAVGASWRLWRSQGGGPRYLIGTGTADTFTDNGVAGDCTVSPPLVGTTHGANTISVTVPGGQPVGVVNFSIYVTLDGSFTSPALLGTYPAADLGVAQTFTAITPSRGAPPVSSTCFPGANPVDAVTQLVNLARAVGIIPATQPPAGPYQFQQADVGTVVESTGGAAVTYTIPENAVVAFPVGAVIEVFQEGAGQVTIAGAAGVTLRSDGSRVRTAAQFSTIGLRQRTLDEWVLSGDLS